MQGPAIPVRNQSLVGHSSKPRVVLQKDSSDLTKMICIAHNSRSLSCGSTGLQGLNGELLALHPGAGEPYAEPHSRLVVFEFSGKWLGAAPSNMVPMVSQDPDLPRERMVFVLYLTPVPLYSYFGTDFSLFFSHLFLKIHHFSLGPNCSVQLQWS